jgi:hypothetical protein
VGRPGSAPSPAWCRRSTDTCRNPRPPGTPAAPATPGSAPFLFDFLFIYLLFLLISGLGLFSARMQSTFGSCAEIEQNGSCLFLSFSFANGLGEDQRVGRIESNLHRQHIGHGSLHWYELRHVLVPLTAAALPHWCRDACRPVGQA